MLQEAPQWDLTEENVMDLKEIFIMFDTDVDGVISIDQVSVHQNICVYFHIYYLLNRCIRQ